MGIGDVTTNLSTTIMGIGLIGNIFAFVIFTRKSLRNTSMSNYCRALLVLDSFIFLTFFKNLVQLITGGYNILGYTLIICKIQNFIGSGIFTTPGLFVFLKLYTIFKYVLQKLIKSY